MIIAEPEAGVDVDALLDGLLTAVSPMLPYAIALGALIVVVRFPLPGRGPAFFQRRDPWRGFRYQARRTVMELAGGRCEGPLFLAWGRCRAAAQEIDHIYPWSKGGATIVNNGQALCTEHNRSKSDMTPAWWYVLGLERRRRGYYPANTPVRVSAAMTAADRSARAAFAARKRDRR